MKRFVVGLIVLGGLFLAAASPATAQTSFDPSRFVGPALGGPRVMPVDDNPNFFQSCIENDNTVLEESPEGFFPNELPSLSACVSSLALGRLSWLAYYQNCQALEGLFASESPTGAPYPYSFYGNPNYTAFNRFDCIYFVWAFHTGVLPPGPGAG